MPASKFHKAVQPSSDRPMFDRLKEHPIWLFCSGAAAMAAFAITVIMPGTTAYLRAQIETLTPVDKQLGKANAQIDKLNKEIETLKKERDEAVLKSPFTVGSAYPKGLGYMVIGSPISKIIEIFPKAKIVTTQDDGDTSGYKSFDTDHSVFRRAAYYYDTTGKSANTINAILFHSIREKFSNEYLYGQLVLIHGEPKAASKQRYFWEIKPRETIALEDGNLYIAKYGYVPIWAQIVLSKKSK
jgi:hypothetical protein